MIVQNMFHLPFGDFVSSLVDAAGRGSNDALFLINRYLPFSVPKSSLLVVNDYIRQTPTSYLRTDLRDAVRQFISEEIRNHEHHLEGDNQLA